MNQAQGRYLQVVLGTLVTFFFFLLVCKLPHYTTVNYSLVHSEMAHLGKFSIIVQTEGVSVAEWGKIGVHTVLTFRRTLSVMRELIALQKIHMCFLEEQLGMFGDCTKQARNGIWSLLNLSFVLQLYISLHKAHILVESHHVPSDCDTQLAFDTR
jgi:hypothetical protein